jgi:hypothetical protein
MGTLRAGILALVTLTGLLSGCGGGASSGYGSGPPPTTYSASGGVAQKGPLQAGSTVTAQELTANLSPSGKQYTYQITSDLGTFTPSSAFGSQYVGITATGYYFDEVANTVSGGPVTLNSYSDLSKTSVLNVNLLTTLAYQRIQKLVSTSGMTFADATTQAENEVLAALNIQHGASYGPFNALDMSKGTDADHLLAAVSSLFVYGNTSGNMAALIASFEGDIANNGRITNAATAATLAASAHALDPAAIAANLSQKYASLGVTFSASDISSWIDQDGDGLVGKVEFQVPEATQSSSFTFPASVTDPNAGSTISVSGGGQLSVNGTPATGPVVISKGDVVAVSPPSGVFAGGAVTINLLSNSTKIARVTFIAGLASIAVTPSGATMKVGTTQQFTATGTFSDSSTADLTAHVTWASDAPTAASMNASTGLASALAPGTAAITATSGLISGTTQLNVIPATVVSIAITPNPFATGVGIARQLTATGTYSDNTTANISTKVTWTSTPNVMVTGGLVTGVSTGTGQVTATLGSVSATQPLTVTAGGSWWLAASMNMTRSGHSATLLQNGKVLVATGGPGTPGPGVPHPLAAEVYDPATDSWSLTGDSDGRYSPAVTLLPNGKVLLAGGAVSGGAALAGTMLYDPATNSWATGANMATVRYGLAGVLLPDGRVLVAGGTIDAQGVGSPPLYSSTEIYNPATNSWSAGPDMVTGHAYSTMTVLADGKVLLAGGLFRQASGTPPAYQDIPSNDAEIYDPVANTWTAVAAMHSVRYNHAMTMLHNGKVLVSGGDYGPPASAELYDPATQTWTVAGNMTKPRSRHTLTVLPNGTVLAVGAGSVADASTEIYDPVADAWSPTGSLNYARRFSTATLLPSGAVLVCGGLVQADAAVTDPFGDYASSCELYW